MKFMSKGEKYKMKNYANELNKKLEEIKESKNRPTLLLHACCAPCSSYVLEYLNSFFDITLYFFNPNISVEQEYILRAAELKRLVFEMGFTGVKIVEEEYNPALFFKIAKGLENVAEGGERCFKCYALRLEKAILYAAEKNFDFVTTTLTISPHKNARVINELGGEIAERYGVNYLFSDFKKNNGYKRSCELSAKYGLYRQNYCGCVYSKR